MPRLRRSTITHSPAHASRATDWSIHWLDARARSFFLVENIRPLARSSSRKYGYPTDEWAGFIPKGYQHPAQRWRVSDYAGYCRGI
jgi:hypothetical protein